jgi:hypothetical protein
LFLSYNTEFYNQLTNYEKNYRLIRCYSLLWLQDIRSICQLMPLVGTLPDKINFSNAYTYINAGGMWGASIEV